MIPTETELRHFLEIYRTRHFTRAAVKIGITQPSLTQSISKLEEKIGTKLFHRTKQGCVPTPSADALHNKAMELQELWQGISDGVIKAESALSGVFRLGCHQSVGAYTLPNFFKSLSKISSEVEVRLHHDWSRRITEKVINYELDLGFVVNPTKHRDLVLTKLGTDRVAFWRRKGVNTAPVIFADVSLSQMQKLIGKRSTEKFAHHQTVETSSLELIRTLVVQGAGIGILPERVAKAENDLLELADPALPTFQDEIYLAHRSDTLKSAAGKAILEAAKSCIKT